MKMIYYILLPFILFIMESCGNHTSIPGKKTKENTSSWTIPAAKVIKGGPAKDGIPALTNPAFVNASQADYLEDDDLVVGYKNGDDIKAYPHAILNYHEIVNDNVNDKKLAVIFCPLTGTATGWNRMLPAGETTFGVSGLVYNTNIIPYDRHTDSYWSQLLMQSVNGELAGQQAENLQVIETSWKTWREMFASTKVLSPKTGFNRNYTNYPYGDYKTNTNELVFAILPDDKRVPRKERVLGIIINGDAKIYRFSSLTKNEGLIEDNFQNEMLVIAGDAKKNIMVAFQKRLPDGSIPVFKLDDSGMGFLKDQFGNTWDVFGVAVEGPLKGSKLNQPAFIMGYWLAFGSFYPNAAIF